MNPTIDNQFKLRFNDLWRLIGNSPLLAIHFTYKGEPRVIYAKSEHYNVTGSIKDRMALYILERAYAENRIKPGDTIVVGDQQLELVQVQDDHAVLSDGKENLTIK